MKEYIELEAALKEFEKVCNVCMALVNKPMCGDCSVADTVRKVKSIPAADARPVVRCCDCKHFQVNVSPSGYLPQGVPEWECRYWCRPNDPTDFCSYGEKREES